MFQFSVVITCYNLRNYIEESVRSVIGQDILHSDTQLECIVVDDGSCDGSAAVLEACAARSPLIRLIEAPHMGVSHARNLGMAAAKGDCILFLDGDDTLAPDCLRRCTEQLKTEPDTDLLVFGIRYLDGVKEAPGEGRSVCPPALSFADGGELADWYIRNRALLLYSCGNKFYRLDKLRQIGLRFREDLDFGEDRLFNYDYLRFCGRIRTMDACFYNYRRANPQSLSTRFRPHHMEEVLALHHAKADCMLGLSTRTSAEEKVDFVRNDLEKESMRVLEHLLDHARELSSEQLQLEYRALFRTIGPELWGWLEPPEELKNCACTARINEFLFPLEETRELAAFDAVLILGSFTCDYRVREALRLFQGLTPDYICSGGNRSVYTDPEGTPLKEAAYMRQVLLENGVQAEKIFLDESSTNTWENLTNTQDWIKRKNVCLVTGGFHVKRVQNLLKKLRLEAVVLPAYGLNTGKDSWYRSATGIAIILSELEKLNPGFAHEAACALLEQLCQIGSKRA